MINLIPFILELGLAENEQLFTQWYNAYFEPLFNYNKRRITDPETALDLTQESFAILFANASKIRNEKHFRRYMYIVSKNLLLDRSRLLKNKPSLSLNLLEEDKGFLPSSDSSFDEKFMLEEIEKILDSIIKQLPEKEKRVLILKNRDGLTYKEISKKTGYSDRQLKRQAKSGLQKVLNQLERQGLIKEGKLL